MKYRVTRVILFLASIEIGWTYMQSTGKLQEFVLLGLFVAVGMGYVMLTDKATKGAA